MGLTIELSCDGLSSQYCYTQYGDQYSEPHPAVVECLDRPFAITMRLKEIRKAARDAGWVKSRDGWLCPPCRKFRDTGKDEE